MNIQFLTILRDNPIQYGTEFNFENEGIPLSEIQQLEQAWNNQNPFPIALKELLYLAGSFCYVLDTGWNNTQQSMQTKAREWMLDYNRNITRPFYVIDVYNAGDQFLMVYLDEGDNPNVYSANLPQGWEQNGMWLTNIDRTLKDFLAFRINKVKQGINPF
jgi:hypothetical protein